MRNRGVAGQNLQILENRTPERLIIDNLNFHRRNSLTDAFGIEMGTEVWIALRFTTHQNTAVGSTRRKSKLAYSRDNASGIGESPTSRGFAVKELCLEPP